MPNWCMTSYAIVGATKDVERISKTLKNHSVYESSSDNWEGNVLIELGMNYDKFKNRSIRGFVQDHELTRINDDESLLKIYCDEAWSRTEFADLLGELFEDIGIWWRAEEPGCELYQTNDEDGDYFPERYFVDTCINGEYDSEYFTSKDAVYEWLSKKCGCKTAEEAEAFNENCDDDDFIYVHAFDICS